MGCVGGDATRRAMIEFHAPPLHGPTFPYSVELTVAKHTMVMTRIRKTRFNSPFLVSIHRPVCLGSFSFHGALGQFELQILLFSNLDHFAPLEILNSPPGAS